MKRFLAALALMISPAIAQLDTEVQIYKGTTELIINGGLDIDTFTGTRTDLQLGMGRFFADNWEAGGILEFHDSDIVARYGLSGFVEYNYDSGTWWIPHFGGKVGYDFFESDSANIDESGVGIGGYVGLKYFFPGYRSLAWAGQIHVDYSTADIYDTDDGVDNIDVAFTMGLRYFLPQK